MLVLLVDVGRQLSLVADQDPPPRADRADEELALGDPTRLVDDERVVVGMSYDLASLADNAFRGRAHQVGGPDQRLLDVGDELVVRPLGGQLPPPGSQSREVAQDMIAPQQRTLFDAGVSDAEAGGEPVPFDDERLQFGSALPEDVIGRLTFLGESLDLRGGPDLRL